MKECRYEYMFPADFIKAVNELPVFIMPTGLLEWHGNHLPLGQDTLKAYGICMEVARKLGGGLYSRLTITAGRGFPPTRER